MKILTIGEVLWDVFPDGEHLGGAPFNFSAHARLLGHEVIFVSAVGRDPRGDKVLERMADLRLETRFVQRVADAPTGMVSVALNAAGVPRFTIHRPAAYDRVRLSANDLAWLSAWKPDWICYGTLHQTDPAIRALVVSVMEACPSARRFYDINLRIDSYSQPLIEQLLPSAAAVKLNDEEVTALRSMPGGPLAAPDPGSVTGPGNIEEFCRDGARRFGWEAVCVTRGAQGCAILLHGEYVEVPGYRVEVVDTVGAGDAFAAAFLHGMEAGWPAWRIGDFANRLGALVASRPGAIPNWTPADWDALVR